MTRLRWGGIFNECFITNFLESVTGKECWKSKIGQYFVTLCVECWGYVYWPNLYVEASFKWQNFSTVSALNFKSFFHFKITIMLPMYACRCRYFYVTKSSTTTRADLFCQSAALCLLMWNYLARSGLCSTQPLFCENHRTISSFYLPKWGH